MPIFGWRGDFTGKHNRPLRHPRELDPLARELRVSFFKRHVRGAARRVLSGLRKFEVTRDSFFEIVARTHTSTLRRAMTPVSALTPALPNGS